LSVAAGVALVAGMMAGTARAQTEYFVATNGVDTADGLSWAAPLLTISNGVAKATAAGAGSTVTVSNGTYNISTQITVSAAITVRSFGGGVTGGLTNAVATEVVGSGCRVFSVAHASAKVDGFTIRGGNGVGDPETGHGAGVLLNGGLLTACVVRNNTNGNNKRGAGVYVVGSGGTVSNCVIRNNTKGGAGMGGGISVYYVTASIVDCKILDNSSGDGSSGHGGGIGIYGPPSSLIRNCLIAGNRAVGNRGGGVYGLYAGATLESCTIASNTATYGGGVASDNNQSFTVRNSIVAQNTAGTSNNYYSVNTSSGWTYSYTWPDLGSYAGMIYGEDPLFVGGGDYTLQATSPCIDKGTNQDTWMVGAKDLAGNTRKTYGGLAGSRGSPVVDMGAYEAPAPPPKSTVIMMR
jgi:hypothetical protein